MPIQNSAHLPPPLSPPIKIPSTPTPKHPRHHLSIEQKLTFKAGHSRTRFYLVVPPRQKQAQGRHSALDGSKQGSNRKGGVLVESCVPALFPPTEGTFAMTVTFSWHLTLPRPSTSPRALAASPALSPASSFETQPWPVGEQWKVQTLTNEMNTAWQLALGSIPGSWPQPPTRLLSLWRPESIAHEGFIENAGTVTAEVGQAWY